MSIFYNLV